MSETIFKADQAPEAPVVENPAPASTLPQEVAEFVGEGKKYKTAEEALKSIPHAQSHIQKLEEELAKQREELARAKAMDELLEEMRRQGQQAPAQVPQAPAKGQAPDVDIDSKVEAILARKQAEVEAKANAQAVINAFQKAFGDEAEQRFVKLSQEVGLPVDYLNNLSMTSPEAVLKLAGLKKEQGTVAKPSSTINTEGSFNTQTQELSAKVPLVGATTKDVLNAWRIAGEKVKQRNA